MKRDYDDSISTHYDQVARECGLAPHSTMADEIIRNRETAAIIEFVAGAAREPRSAAPPTVLDVGCGNGYTLKRLATELPGCTYLGIEYNDRLRALAAEQTGGLRDVRVLPGDIRARSSLEVTDGQVDVLVCQRVLINLLSRADAQLALDNLVSLVRSGGRMLFIESFDAALARLNEARAEFGLEAIPPAHHNRYLEEDFFVRPELEPIELGVPRNALSTHYYVTRVLHAALCQGLQREFLRNSHFVKFLSAALPAGVGDFAPLQFRGFVRRTRA
jgi:SAM-dependent methyltransferase